MLYLRVPKHHALGHRANATLPPYVLRNLLIGTGWTEADLRRLKLVG